MKRRGSGPQRAPADGARGPIGRDVVARAAAAGRLLGAAVLAVVGACSDDDAGKPANVAPTARLTITPAAIRVGESAAFDASGSTDSDGMLVRYRFLWPDGTPESASTMAMAGHRFDVGGEMEVGVVVEDDRGGEGRASAHLSVAAQPMIPCGRDGDCAMGEVCRTGRCLVSVCDAMRACPKPLMCEADECVPPPQTCVDKSNCGAGMECREGRCV